MDQQTGEPTLREYFLALYRRKLTVLVVLVITTGAVAVGAYLTPPVFTASTTLIVRFGREFVYTSEVAGLASSRTFKLEEMVNSEVEILNSRDLARQVVEELGVETLYPDLLEQNVDTDTAVAVAAFRFRDQVSVTAVFDSSVIRISFGHADAEVAARALNTLVERFRDKHLEVFGDSRADFLRSQLEEFRKRLASTEAALQSFRGANGIYQIVEQKAAMLGERVQLGTDLRATQLRLGELEYRLKALEDGGSIPAGAVSHSTFSSQRVSLMERGNQLSSLLEGADFRIAELTHSVARYADREQRRGAPAVLDPGAGRIRSLDEALIRFLDLQLREKELQRTHREESRELVAVRAEKALVRTFLEERGAHVERTLEAAIRDELGPLRFRREELADQIAKIDTDLRDLDSRERALHVETLRTEFDVARSRQETLVAELARRDVELAMLGSKASELHRLERELTVSESAYQRSLTRFEEARALDELDERKMVNVRLIEAAAPPVTPAGHSKWVTIAVGAVVGLIAGLSVAFVVELLGH